MIDIGHNIWGICYGRGGETRTCGLYVPNVALPTALHPVVVSIFFSGPNAGLGVQYPLDLVREDQFSHPEFQEMHLPLPRVLRLKMKVVSKPDTQLFSNTRMRLVLADWISGRVCYWAYGPAFTLGISFRLLPRCHNNPP